MLKTTYASVEEMLATLRPSYPVFCVRPDVLAASAGRFLDRFPGRVLYAVKCNSHPLILKLLYDAGIRHFDTASLPEIALVRELFNDADLYFHHPVKGRAAIQSAHQVYGVRHYTIDHAAELAKLHQMVGSDGVVAHVRLATPPGYAQMELSSKFGAEQDQAVELLRQIAAVDMVPGLSFHVGSQCSDPRAYVEALKIVDAVLDRAGVEVRFLNIGGGFPAEYRNKDVASIEDFLDAVATGRQKLGLRNDCVLMCEPGRAMVADAASLMVQVQLRKGNNIYINDGIFGSLSEIKYADLDPPVTAIRLDGEFDNAPQDFTVYGPTCDSIDVLPCTFQLPADVAEGDWIEIGQLGAYSNALSTNFNGFRADTFVVIGG